MRNPSVFWLFYRDLFFLCALGMNKHVKGINIGQDQNDAIREPGHIILGGLFPMHEKGTRGRLCGEIKEDKGIQRVEAMLFSIDMINNDTRLLPGIMLGAHILDTCLRDTYALEQSLAFIKGHMGVLSDPNKVQCSPGQMGSLRPSQFDPGTTSTNPKNTGTGLSSGLDGDKTIQQPVAGVIGAAASPVSIMVANILRLFEIPQISYASTAVGLSDKSRFAYFSRVVAPDTYQAQAMVDLVKAFNWTYVSTLADEGDYGEKGIDTFKDKAENSGICIAKSLEIPRDIKTDTFHKIIRDLLDNTKAKVVVLFVNEDNCHRLVKAAADMKVTDDLQWLASDSWGAKSTPVKQQKQAAEGTITILPQREVVKAFDEYFLKLNPRENVRNPWFKEFWEKHFECSFDERNALNKCTGYERLKAPPYKQEGIVPFVIDAVYAMAHAIDHMIKAECGGEQFCEAANPPSGKKLLQYIRNVSYIGVAGQTVSFNVNGDAQGRYTIYQFQRTPTGHYDYVPIGNWSDTLSIDISMTRWRSGDGHRPRSVCSEPCPDGHKKQDDEALDKCCWVCIPCESHMILKGDSECEPCSNGSYPNSAQTTCHPLPIQYISLDSAWAILPVIVASLGIILTLFVAVVFMRFNNTPVIMASGRELCYVLMAGLLMCYVMTYVMVTKPTTVTCCLMRVGLGLSLSICYAALFTKTNRISRIFNRGVKAMVKRPSYTSPRSQLVICLCLVSVQILVAIVWVGIELPSTTRASPDRKTVVLRCKSTNVAIVLSLLYNMILIMLCTIYAFKTRKIPENFNEAKHIAFTMYSTCIVWLAFIPIYFGTHRSDFRIQITALCMCVSISATVTLGCMFVPKVYIVLFQPHKNVRQGAKGSIGSGATGRPFFGRQSSRFSSLAAMNGDITSPTGIALLIAKGSLPKDPQDSDKGESLKDLDSSGLDNSEPETHV